MSRSLRIVVVGAGIGGLTAACALRKRGFEVSIFERSPALGEVGAGVQIAPNAVKVLRALGLEDKLRSVATEPNNIVSLEWDSARLRMREPLKAIAVPRYGDRYYMAHRADLLRILIEALPESIIRLGMQCVGTSSSGDSAVAHFADGTAVEADVVVGADGIRSNVRESMFGADAPRFTGQTGWRAIIPIECVPTEVGPNRSVKVDRSDFVGWIGPAGHVICYPICSGTQYNIFAGHNSNVWAEESWSVASTRAEMLRIFTGWNDALLAMLGAVESCSKWGLYDRDPLSTWIVGGVALLGDAAHPMMPTLAQGAAISIEDGYALARNLAAYPDSVPQALTAYNAERVPRCTQVQLQARVQFENNKKIPAPPALDRGWIFAHDVTHDPVSAA